MSRTLLTLIVVLFVVLCQPKPAEAAFWAWLEKWSGPGPFKAKVFQTLLFTMCLQDRPTIPVSSDERIEEILRHSKGVRFVPSPVAMNNTFHMTREAAATRMAEFGAGPKRDILRGLLANPEFTTWASLNPAVLAPFVTSQPVQLTREAESAPDRNLMANLAGIYLNEHTRVGGAHAHERLVCGYFDIGSFAADEDPARGFPQLTARLYDIGPSARVHDGVDIGGGFGWVRFEGQGVDFSKMTFTPLRVILRPLVIAVPDDLRRDWMGVFSFFWKETYVKGPLTAMDFNAPNNDWSEDGELIRSFGITLDATAALPVISRWFNRLGD